MAITVKSLCDQLSDRYSLRVLAGEKDMDFSVTWVHMLEDTRVADFFQGNEIVVTSGYTIHSEADFLDFITTLDDRHCCGIVVNTGPYINTIPESAIRKCSELELPLITMPWEMSMTEFVRSCCSLITRDQIYEEDIAEAVMQVVKSPQDAAGYSSTLSEFFHEENGFTWIAMTLETTIAAYDPERIDQRSILRMHTALREFNFPKLIFRQGQRVFILLNTMDVNTAHIAANSIIARVHERFPNIPVRLGVGDPAQNYEQLSDGHIGAVSAQRCAVLQQQEMVFFRNMGFYRLLYSVPNDELLRDFYSETLSAIIRHDAGGDDCYMETLFRYLLNDGSLQATAAAMYTHRNTVGYRMGRIRELLNSPLDTPESRLPYLLAYHIGVMLRLNPEYQ